MRRLEVSISDAQVRLRLSAFSLRPKGVSQTTNSLITYDRERKCRRRIFLQMANKILFLCTGNYYRSRFAEILFNSLVSERELNWKADSRALALELGVNNVGPMSRYVTAALAQRGIELTGVQRYPIQVKAIDFEEADAIIALKESEHRPYLLERYPDWADKVEYWDVTDGIPTAKYDPLGEIEREINRLIQRLCDFQTSGVPSASSGPALPITGV